MVLWQEEISFILFYVHCKSCTIKEFLFSRTDEDRALSEFSPAASHHNRPICANNHGIIMELCSSNS